MEEIKVADTARYVSFYAYDSADHISPADGITSFTVYFYLNNGSVTGMAPAIVTEKDSTNMKGWYTLAVDDAPMVSAEGVLSINIEATGMDPVAIKVKIVGNTTKEVYDRIGAPIAASISADLVVIDNFVDDLESRLTAIRAGYLDNLNGHTPQTGDSYAVTNHVDYGNSKLVRSTTPANALDVSATGEAGLDFANIKDATGAHTLTNITVPTATNLTNAATNGDLTATMKTSVNTEADTALTDYDGPTNAEMEARTLPTADYVVTTDTIAGVTTATNLTNAPTAGDLTATMKTSINTEVADVIKTDTIAEMAQGVPSATPTLEDAIMYIYMHWRNETTTTATIHALKNDGGTVIAKSTISDDATTFTKGEYVSGP